MIFPIFLIITGFLVGQLPSAYNQTKLNKCLNAQINNYSDLCAESGTNYEQMSGRDAHFDGVTCAVESIQICMATN